MKNQSSLGEGAELMIGSTNVSELLKQKYTRLASGWITLLQIPIEYSMDVNVESIKSLQSLGYEGIYITLSKPAIELEAIFRENGIEVSKIYFVDGITQMYGSKQIERVEYVLGPLAIDAISSSVYKLIPKIKSKKRFVFLDSITTVLLYNSLPRTLQFSNFLTETLKKKKLVGIVVSVSRGLANTKLIAQLEKLSDEVIMLSEK